MGPPYSSFNMAVNRFFRWRLRSGPSQGNFPTSSHNNRRGLVWAVLWRMPLWLRARPNNELAVLGNGNSQQHHCNCCTAQLQFSSRNLQWHGLMHVCVCLGAPWRKGTVVIANRHNVEGVHRSCPSTPHTHIKLEGKAPDGRSWTAVAGPYWPAFAREWATCWDEAKTSQRRWVKQPISGVSLVRM